jgi:hypothetical protein
MAKVECEIEREVGKGSGFVYVWFYPSDKDSTRRLSWRCKVGYTNVGVTSRVLANKEVMPEVPVIGLVIRTDRAKLLEKEIHRRLKEDGKWLDEACGNEWFETSPSEVEDLYNLIRLEGEPVRARPNWRLNRVATVQELSLYLRVNREQLNLLALNGMPVMRQPHGPPQYHLKSVITWLQERYPEKYNDLPLLKE